MANTPIYGFETPDDTDLVKDGALSIRTALGDVDTTLGTALNSKDHAGLVLVKKQTVGTGVSSVSVTDAFSSTYENYRIIMNVDSASAQSDVQFSLNGITSGYYSSLIYVTHGSTTVLGASQANAAFIQWLGGTTAASSYLDCNILRPNVAKPKIVNGYFLQQTTGGAGGPLNGWINSSVQATGFTITPQTGTLTGGTIYVYGYGAS
jgi:hypothetical protein